MKDESLNYRGLSSIDSDEKLKKFIEGDHGFLFHLLSCLSAQGDAILSPEIIQYFTPYFLIKFNISTDCKYTFDNTFNLGYGYGSRLLPKGQHYSIKTEAIPSPEKGWKIHLSIADYDGENLERALPVILRLFFKYQLPHLKIKNLARVASDSECKLYERGKQITFYLGNEITSYEVEKLTNFVKELTAELKNENIEPSYYGENVRYVTPYVGYKNDNATLIPESSSGGEYSQEREFKYRPPEERGYKLDEQNDPFKIAFDTLSREFEFNPVHQKTKQEIKASETEEEKTPTSTTNKASPSVVTIEENKEKVGIEPKSDQGQEKSTKKKPYTRSAVIPLLNLSASQLASTSFSTSQIKSKQITSTQSSEKSQKKAMSEKKRKSQKSKKIHIDSSEKTVYTKEKIKPLKIKKEEDKEEKSLASNTQYQPGFFKTKKSESTERVELSRHTKSIAPIKVFSTTEGRLFEVYKVAKDGNCGYTAFGIDREQAYKLLKENIIQIQDFLISVVKEQLLNENFINYLINNNFATHALSTAFQAYRNEAIKGNQKDKAESHLFAYANDLTVVNGYLSYDVKDKKVDAGWSHPCVLQALAHIRGIQLTIWIKNENRLAPHQQYHEYVPKGVTESKHLLFINGNHFELLLEKDTKQLEPDNPEKEKSSTATTEATTEKTSSFSPRLGRGNSNSSSN